MRLYLLCNPAIADEFNMSLMRLIVPSHRAGGNSTKYLAVKHVHPETGYAALAVDDTHTIPVCPTATGEELDYLLGIFVADGAMTQEEADVIRQQVMDSLGQQVNVLDFVPATWSGYVLTREQMNADGWFPPEELE